MGLDNIHTRVNRYGGRVDITSALGEGTEVEVSLPA
jgi:signal transduction histidine kinase